MDVNSKLMLLVPMTGFGFPAVFGSGACDGCAFKRFGTGSGTGTARKQSLVVRDCWVVPASTAS